MRSGCAPPGLYLGASDSPVRLRVTTRIPPHVSEKNAFIPDPRGDTVINVTRSGDLNVLDRMYDQWRERGGAVSRQQFPALAHGTPYRSPGSAERIDNGTVVAWLRLGAAVSGRRISEAALAAVDQLAHTHTELFKRAGGGRRAGVPGGQDDLERANTDYRPARRARSCGRSTSGRR